MLSPSVKSKRQGTQTKPLDQKKTPASTSQSFPLLLLNQIFKLFYLNIQYVCVCVMCTYGEVHLLLKQLSV